MVKEIGSNWDGLSTELSLEKAHHVQSSSFWAATASMGSIACSSAKRQESKQEESKRSWVAKVLVGSQADRVESRRWINLMVREVTYSRSSGASLVRLDREAGSPNSHKTTLPPCSVTVHKHCSLQQALFILKQ